MTESHFGSQRSTSLWRYNVLCNHLIQCWNWGGGERSHLVHATWMVDILYTWNRRCWFKVKKRGKWGDQGKRSEEKLVSKEREERTVDGKLECWWSTDKYEKKKKRKEKKNEKPKAMLLLIYPCSFCWRGQMQNPFSVTLWHITAVLYIYFYAKLAQ